MSNALERFVVMRQKTIVSFFLAVASLQLTAETVEISTVEALISASASASKDYVLMKSGSPYVLPTSTERAHKALWATFRLRGETGDPKDVQIVGNGNTIFYLGSASNVISGITFTNGYASILTPTLATKMPGGALTIRTTDARGTVVSNCIFACNRSSNGGAVCFQGAVDDVVFDSCTFVGNVATNSGGAVWVGGASATSLSQSCGTLRGCTFCDNVASNYGGAAYGIALITNCTFAGNAAKAAGASYNAMTCIDVVFTNNSATVRGGAIARGHVGPDTNQLVRACRFLDNFSGTKGGALATDGVTDDAGIIEGCLFDGNFCTGQGTGGAVAGEKCVSNCVFRCNQTPYYGGAAHESSLFACRLERNYGGSAGGGVYDCKLYNCTNVANLCGNNGCEAYKGYAEACLFRDTCPTNSNAKAVFSATALNRCRVENVNNAWLAASTCSFTNTLFARCGDTGATIAYVYNPPASGVHFVNCTIVSNVLAGCKAGGTARQATYFANCLFYGNRFTGGTKDCDLGDRVAEMMGGCTNCIFAASPDKDIPGTGNYNYYADRATFVPGFVGEAADPLNPYALKRSAYGVKKMHGLVADWMTDATDIRGEGFARLREGVVDIGCYQCWIPVPGCALIFR